MFVIMVYDIKEERVNKVLNIGRRYLRWVQNSVLEGELTYGRLMELKHELKDIIKPNEDSIIFYTFRTRRYFNRETMGLEKGGLEVFI